jgi:hypothetical protein
VPCVAPARTPENVHQFFIADFIHVLFSFVRTTSSSTRLQFGFDPLDRVDNRALCRNIALHRGGDLAAKNCLQSRNFLDVLAVANGERPIGLLRDYLFQTLGLVAAALPGRIAGLSLPEAAVSRWFAVSDLIGVRRPLFFSLITVAPHWPSATRLASPQPPQSPSRSWHGLPVCR